MEFLPLFLRIRDRDCVVIGGGEVAARKVALLRRIVRTADVVMNKH